MEGRVRLTHASMPQKVWPDSPFSSIFFCLLFIVE